MVDIQTVIERLEALKAYLAELDHCAKYSFEEIMADCVKYRAIERSLQLAAQAVVDVAAHIITGDFNARVQDYRQAIEKLGEVGVLPPEFAQQLAPIAGFRNILVHEYLTIDPDRVYEMLIHGRADLQEFGRHVAAYLQRSGALEEE